MLEQLADLFPRDDLVRDLRLVDRVGRAAEG